jgi:hypothetical protein
MHDAVLTLTLPDEERTDTIRSFDDAVLFRYLPARLKGQEAALHIRDRFGKSAMLKGLNLEESGTTIERNGQVGGHRA